MNNKNRGNKLANAISKGNKELYALENKIDISERKAYCKTGKNRSERKDKVLQEIQKSKEALSASFLGKKFGCSRQAIVSDIALLRARGEDILSTAKGYIILRSDLKKRLFKIWHSEKDAAKEMSLIVEAGGKIEDVSIFHRFYGQIVASLKVSCKKDIDDFIDSVNFGKSSFLMNAAGGYHYHTISTEKKETLDLIETKLRQAGFLASLTDLEPIGAVGA